jgi:hypothetical protein
MGAHSGLEHRALFQFSRLSLRNTKTRSEKCCTNESQTLRKLNLKKCNSEEQPVTWISPDPSCPVQNHQNNQKTDRESKLNPFRRTQSENRKSNTKGKDERETIHKRDFTNKNHTNIIKLENATLRRSCSEKRPTSSTTEINEIPHSISGSTKTLSNKSEQITQKNGTKNKIFPKFRQLRFIISKTSQGYKSIRRTLSTDVEPVTL